jgi:hypothetical protein
MLHGEHVFVRNVRSATIMLDPATLGTGMLRAIGSSVAYGLHAGNGCTVDVTRVVLDGGGYGIFNAEGSMHLRHGLITIQANAAAAASSPGALEAIRLDEVVRRDNADDELSVRTDLPAAAALPAPTPIAL